jgi:uncharacterized repeat protein (TIGR01451 family)
VTWSIDETIGNFGSFEITGAAGSQQLLLKGQPVSLKAHESLTVHVTAPTSSSSCGTTYNNTAEVTTTNDGSGTASASEEVLCANIEVEKTADATSVSAGEAIGFTVTVKNSGAGEATGVELSDALPGGTAPVSWSIDETTGDFGSFEITGAAGSQQLLLKGQPVSLKAHESRTVHVTAPTSSSSCGTTYNNTAEVTTTNDGSGTASASEEVLCANIEVEKTADATSVFAGEAIGFTVTVKNSGAGEATGVELSDALPGGNASTPVSWSIDPSSTNAGSFEITGAAGSQELIIKAGSTSLAAGANLVVHVTAQTSKTSCTTYNNTAEVTTTNDGSGTASASEEVLCAAIKVTKTADAASVSAGSPIGFTVTVKNEGAGTATGVELKDALPGGNTGHEVTWSIDKTTGNFGEFEITGSAGSQRLLLKGQPVSLAAGASLTVHVTAGTSSTSCTTYNNTAEATTTNDGSSSASASESVLCSNFTVEKLQKIGGGSFTKNQLTGNIGETVDYEIVVTNTGEAPLKVEAIVDVNCTNIHGPGKSVLATGESTTYTCEHKLTEAGTYTNVATVAGNEKAKESNSVSTVVPAPPAPIQVVKAVCTVSESSIVLHGVGGSKRAPFTVTISALGIKQITFYLDGHKLKTLTKAQAKHGKFTIRINPRKLSYGAHKVSLKTIMSDANCAKLARARVFVHPRPHASVLHAGVVVHPRPPVVKPKFKG